MRYQIETTIALPRGKVIELFDDPANLPKWQPGLISFTHVSGEAGQPGAKSELIYQIGARRVEMVETIEKRELPDVFTGTYEASGVWNRIANYFHEDGPERTRWVIDTEFRFTGIMKAVAFLMPGSFKKQTRQSMEDFKRFAESAGE